MQYPERALILTRQTCVTDVKFNLKVTSFAMKEEH